MDEESTENLDSENQATEEVVENAEVTQEEATEQPEFTEAEKKLYARTKKAEADAKLAKKELAELIKASDKASDKQEVKDISTKDLYALMDAKVPEADVDEVVRAAKLLGKSIPEALKDGLVKARLRDMAEQRETANATNTTGSKRTTAKVTDEGLVEKAMRGGDVDPEALAIARINLKKAQKK